MPEGVWTYALADAGLPRRLGDGLLENGLVEVKAGWWSPSRIGTDARGWK